MTDVESPLALDPYIEGMMDFDDGVICNPYPEDDPRSSLWREGWRDASMREE